MFSHYVAKSNWDLLSRILHENKFCQKGILLNKGISTEEIIWKLVYYENQNKTKPNLHNTFLSGGCTLLIPRFDNKVSLHVGIE